MKKLYCLAFAAFISLSLRAQNFVPLRIDSSYAWSFSISFELDTLISETSSAYFYDALDSLVLRRNPASRIHYSYVPDTTYSWNEILDIDHNWVPNARSRTAFSGPNITSRLTQNYVNQNWVNSALTTYQYNVFDLPSVQLTQLWKNGAWADFYKKESIYDSGGSNVEDKEFYTNSSGVLEYNRGRLMAYDNIGRRIQEINVNASINGSYYTSRTQWDYGDDDLLDTIRRCNYQYPNNGLCDNVFMDVYNYPAPTVVREKYYSWSSNQWQYGARIDNFKGPGIYSDKPDSVLTYQYVPSNMSEVLRNRRYFQYQELGNNKVYFRDETFNFDAVNGTWSRTAITEEWYHLKGSVGVQTPETSYPMVFPNPCRPGQQLTVRSNDPVEYLIFDVSGRLAGRGEIISGVLTAPERPGVYSIVFRKDGKLTGVDKLIVTD